MSGLASTRWQPWCRAIEAEFARSVFSDPARFHLEIDLSQLLRGDYATRAQVGINLLRAGALTANELRAEIGYNPLPGGDKLMPQLSAAGPAGPRTEPATRCRRLAARTA
jgi:phage portal protein BeeE